ncbi:hypothetical protein GJ496_000759 [Pomphorhynchus laevis]|nr:hypothetical protein GJ496_000759 [Pomphorhynchus laevis]
MVDDSSCRKNTFMRGQTTIDRLNYRQMESSNKDDSVRFIFSVRFIVAVMACLCLAIQYSQRVNLTMGIVCMVNKTAVSIIQEQSKSVQNLADVNSSQATSTPTNKQITTLKPRKANKKFKDGPFIWTKPVQGRVLSAYFFGYIAFQIGGAMLASKFGPYRVLISAMSLGTLTTFLTPPLAKMSYVAVIILRVLTGLSAGVVWPAMVELCTRWSPKHEKSTILAIGNSGAQIGPLFSMPLFGALCASSLLGGWPLVYYVSGGLGLVWIILCIILISSNPQKHRFMSAKEKAYIQRHAILKSHEKNVKQKQAKVPFGKIFKSIPCIAMFSSHFFKAFGFYTILTNISTYYEEILKLDLISSGYLTAIPYVCYWICTVASGKMADYLIKRKILSISPCRKLFTAIGSFGPAITVFALGFIDHRIRWVGILMITLTLAFLGFNSGGGMYIVCQDMAPKFASTLWGISNTFGTAPGIIVPLVIGLLTKNRILKEWRVVFIICAVSYVVSGLAFVLFGSAELQPWANINDNPHDADELEKMT